MKRGAFFVQREGLAGAHHPRAVERVTRKLQWPNPPADAARHLIQWRAVGGNGVPDANEVNFFDRTIVGLVVIFRQKQIADRAEKILDVPDGVVPLAPVLAVGRTGLLVELRFALGRHQALVEHEAYDDADRKGAPAETKSVDAVVRIAIIAAGKFVNIDYVALEAIPEGASENSERLERRGADAVVIERDLVGAGQVQRLEGAPDIGAPHLRRGIAGAVGQQNNISAHGIASILSWNGFTTSGFGAWHDYSRQKRLPHAWRGRTGNKAAGSAAISDVRG